MNKSVWVFVVIVVSIIVGAGLWFFFNGKINANQAQSPLASTPNADTIKLTTSNNGISYLTDANGLALYYFAKDNINKSNCTGQCLVSWPPFYIDNVAVSAPLDASNFGTITNDANQKITTYHGRPLYHYTQDQAPGDAKGQGYGSLWYILPDPFYTVMLQNKTTFDNYLVDPRGMTLYYFKHDTQGTSTTTAKSSCTGQCLTTWPAFYTENLIAPSLLLKSDFSEITRDDGSQQVTYKGWPLYYYSADINPGDTNGDNVGGAWFVAKP